MLSIWLLLRTKLRFTSSHHKLAVKLFRIFVQRQSYFAKFMPVLKSCLTVFTLLFAGSSRSNSLDPIENIHSTDNQCNREVSPLRSADVKASSRL